MTFHIGNAPLLPGLLGIKEFDIVHLHHPFIFGAEMIWAVSRARKIPYVVTHHNDLIGDGLRRHLFNAYSAVSTRLVFGAACRLAVVSLDHAASCRLAPLFRKQWPKVVEIPNGVDTDLFRPDVDATPIRQQYAIPADAKVILFVGTLDRAHHYRRVDLLLEAVKVVQDRALHVLVVGGGDQMPEYQRLAQKLGVRSRVHFLGAVAHQALPGVYSAADLVALPSQLQESFGLVLIEAMACGKPVVASRLPGVRTVVSDGEDGLLVQPGDVLDLAEKIQTLLRDPQRHQEMGKRGRAKVEEKYAWRQVVPQLMRVYDDVLGGGNCD
jgi:glycosyltransferase involved in cell wall biosynthesis